MKKNTLCCIEITDKCNLNCSFCCKAWRKAKNGDASQEMLDRLLNDEEINSFLITGGEPTLAKNLFYFIDNNKKPYSINSNLSFLDKFLPALKRQKNLVRINFDFPSHIESIYNKITNSKLIYKKVIMNLEKTLTVLSSDIVSATIVLSKENAVSWKDTVLWLSTMYGIKNFTISIPISTESDFNKKQQIKIYSDILNFSKTHAAISIKTLAKTLLSDKCPITHECSAGLDRFVVMANGDTVPCAWNKDTIIGNVMHDSTKKILEQGRMYFESFPKNKRNICKGCL